MGSPDDAFIPRKTYPTGRGRVLESALVRNGVDPDLARKLAAGISASAEQTTLDEEANYNAIEDWLRHVVLGKDIRWITVADTAPDVTTYDPGNQNDLWVDTSGLEDIPADLVEIAPYAAGVTSGSAVELLDGRILYVWSEGTSIRQGHSPDLATFTGTAGSVVFNRDLFTGLNTGRCAVAKQGGRLLLTTFWWSKDGDNTARGQVHESLDEGVTWTLLSEFDTLGGLGGVTIFSITKTVCGPIRELNDNSLIMAASRADTRRLSFSETWPQYVVWRSTDSGATWSARLAIDSTAMAYPKHMTRTIGGAAADLYVSLYYSGTADETRIYRSTNHGASWVLYNTIPTGTFADAYPAVHVAPRSRGASGYEVNSLGWNTKIQRWLVQSLADPVSLWEQVGDTVDWSPSDSGHTQALIQSVGEQDVLFVQGVVGTNIILGSGFAELNLWDVETGEWVPVASARVVQHSHDEYSGTGHTHALEDHVLADHTDVSAAAPTVEDALVWDGTGWGPAAQSGAGGGAAGHWEVIVTGSPPTPVLNPEEDDWLYGLTGD